MYKRHVFGNLGGNNLLRQDAETQSHILSSSGNSDRLKFTKKNHPLQLPATGGLHKTNN